MIPQPTTSHKMPPEPDDLDSGGTPSPAPSDADSTPGTAAHAAPGTPLGPAPATPWSAPASQKEWVCCYETTSGIVSRLLLRAEQAHFPSDASMPHATLVHILSLPGVHLRPHKQHLLALVSPLQPLPFLRFCCYYYHVLCKRATLRVLTSLPLRLPLPVPHGTTEKITDYNEYNYHGCYYL